MSTIAQVEGSIVASDYEAAQAKKKSKVSGKTIGQPELSEKGQKYYEELKKKYSNMDFVLVSKDMKEQAKAQAGNYANPNRMVVLIDEEKIERMAEDENYRKQYESIIKNAATKLPELQSSLGKAASNVKTFGMKVNDNGTASYFAVVDKSLASQRDRIEKNAAKKKEAQKTADKKAVKKAAEEKLDKKRLEGKEQDEDTVMVEATTIDELIEKINQALYGDGNRVRTEEERALGQHIDFWG